MPVPTPLSVPLNAVRVHQGVPFVSRNILRCYRTCEVQGRCSQGTLGH